MTGRYKAVLAYAQAHRVMLSLCGLFFVAYLFRFLRTDGDFDVYYAAALRFLHGASIHVVELNPFTYPGVVAVLIAPFTALGHDATKILFYVICCAALVLGITLTNRELLDEGSRLRRWAFLISLLFTVRFVLSALNNQQTDLIIFGLVTLGAWGYARRGVSSPVAWSFAVAFKLNPLFLLVVPVFHKRWRYVAGFLSMVLVLMLVPDLLKYAVGGDSMPASVEVPTTVIARDDRPATREVSLSPVGRDAFAYARDLVELTTTPVGGGVRWWEQRDNPLNQSLTRIVLHFAPPAVSPWAVVLVFCSLFALALWPLALRPGVSPFMLGILAYEAFVLIGPVSSKPHFVAMYGALLICWQQVLRNRSWPAVALLVVISGAMGLTSSGALGARAYDLAVHGNIGIAALDAVVVGIPRDVARGRRLRPTRIAAARDQRRQRRPLVRPDSRTTGQHCAVDATPADGARRRDGARFTARGGSKRADEAQQAPGAEAPDVSIVVPTLREAPNVAVLAPRISRAMAATGLSHDLTVVDDDSRDGIDVVCRELAASLPVRLVVRNERGLATAVLAGIEASRGRYVVVMDADQSHPADAIPELLEPLIAGSADFVVGSRYVAGSSVDVEWTLFRRITSRTASLLVAPLTNLADPLAGFFAVRRAELPDLGGLSPLGYKVGLELLVRGDFRRVTEVPIHFSERAYGRSKLDLRQSLLFAAHVLRLLRYRYLGR